MGSFFLCFCLCLRLRRGFSHSLCLCYAYALVRTSLKKLTYNCTVVTTPFNTTKTQPKVENSQTYVNLVFISVVNFCHEFCAEFEQEHSLLTDKAINDQWVKIFKSKFLGKQCHDVVYNFSANTLNETVTGVAVL